jgi:hypothetical protein
MQIATLIMRDNQYACFDVEERGRIFALLLDT